MGSYDGAETCELVGIYILHKLADRTKKDGTGLYRDDGLILLHRHNERQIDKARKDIAKISKDIGFNIEIKTNLKIVDFLDITFNLIDGIYRPFKKPDDKLSYLHTSSNHPPFIRQIPSSICCRLSDNSSNEEMFNMTKEEYETALKNSSHSASLQYTARPTKRKRSRKRSTIWFNPPYSRNVSAKKKEILTPR